MKKLKITSLILAVIMVVSMLPLGMVSAFAAGPSDESNPTIGTAAEFVEFMENWMGTEGYYDGKTVTLTADIDLSGVELPKLYAKNDGTYSKIENTFTGTFDGAGYTISGYAIVNSRGDGISDPANINDVYGLFGRQLSGEATIKDLTLNGVLGKDYPTEPKTGATVNAADVGALYGYVVNGGSLTVENVTVNGITSGSRSAGFVYRVNAGGEATFTNCEMGGKVLNTWTQGVTDGVGGFVASNLGTVTIENCLMSGYVALMRLNTTGGTNGMIHMGGLVGNNQGTLTITGSVVSGSVISHSTSVKTASQNVGLGGFVGYTKGSCTIEGSMIHQSAKLEAKLPASATTNSGYNVGGFVGRGEDKTGTLSVTNCAMYGTVTSNSLRSGMYFGQSGADALTLIGCISNGTGTMNNRTNQLGYGGNNNAVTAQYNIQGTTSSQGKASVYGGSSKYGKPYHVTAANLYTLETLETTIAKLKTFEEGTADAEAWTTEVAAVMEYYAATDDETGEAANWTFSGSALPIPAACADALAMTDWYANETANGNTTLEINNLNELLAFATAINGGKTFEGLTVKLTADITMNEGWDAFAKTEATLTGDDKTTEKAITAASTKWPVGSGKSFAGTFDGQGYTISGIYQVVNNQNVGIFGNVTTGTATVKNVTIKNSYVRGGQGTGGFFGIVSAATAKVDNVYANINVDSGYVNTTLGSSNYTGNTNRSNGTGGLVGGCNNKASNITVTNTVFEGEVYGGHLRGVSAISGNATTTGKITIENCYVKATITSDAGLASSNKQAAAGAFVGYVGNASAQISLKNVVSDTYIGGSGSLFSNLFAGNHVAISYNVENVTFVNYADDKANDVANTKAGTVINGGTALTDVSTTLSDDDWKAYGVKEVATAAELPAVLYAYNVDETMSLTLTDDLAVNLFADFAIVNEARADATVKKVGNEYKITYSGILPQQIGDDIDLDLGAGGTKTVNIKNDYLVKLLDNEKAKHVVADLLRYGAAAQKVADPEIADSDLVTYGLDLDGLGSTIGAIDAADPVLSDGCTFVGVALRLESSLALVARDAEGTETTKSLMATQMDDVLTVTDGTSSVDVSVAWYVAQAMNGAVSDPDELALIEAIYAYGLSAKAYKA